jgi:hypothetical protein
MEPGEARGSLRWTEPGRSALRRMLTPGKQLIVGKSFTFTLTVPRLEGHRCESCGLTLLKDLRQGAGR